MLAGNIKDARERAGLTQQELADKVGVKRSSLSSWEIDRTKPDLDTFIKLCHVLHIRSDDLLGLAFEEEIANLKQPVVEVARLIAKLPPAEFSMIRKVVTSIADEENRLKK